MMDLQREKILASLEAEDFIGRSNELDALLRHARATDEKSRGLLVAGAPFFGVSELLRQTYDRLFNARGELIPFYFALRKSDRTARQAAERFLQQFLQQTVAYRRADRKILAAAPDVEELAEIAPPADGYWIDRLVEACRSENRRSGDAAFVRNCLSSVIV
jgi:hypothetical protein